MLLACIVYSIEDLCIQWGPGVFVALCGISFVIYSLARPFCKNRNIRLSDENLEKNLDDYLSIRKPDFAVMITGRWGTGKTYFIKQYMRKKWNIFSWKKPIYVSLYGVKSEKQLEMELVKSLYIHPFSVRDISILFIFIVLIIGLFVGGVYQTIPLWSTNQIEAMNFWGPVLITLAVLLYKGFRFYILEILLWKRPLVFDDFERAKYPPDELLAYINRYVEHMNKHVIIICNEEEIGGNDEEKEKYAKMHEKVIGQCFYFSQNQLGVMKQLLRPEDYPMLNGLLTECFSWEWFQSASTPQWKVVRSTEDSFVKEESEEQKQENFLPFNLRVWLFCCSRFEKIFAGVSVDLLHEKAVWRKLIPQFFAPIYAMQIHDFGDKKIFPTHAHDYFEPSAQDKSLSWFEDLFPKIREEGRKDALPCSEWFNIVDNRIIDIKHVNDYWAFLCYGDSALWARLYDYFEKADEENEKNWNELKNALKERRLSEPGELMSIFGTVLDMIENQCCPEECLTHEKAFCYAKSYLEHIKLPQRCSRMDYVFWTDARGFRTYEHHGRALSFFTDFKVALSEKIQRCQEEAITDNFQKFLALLPKAEDEFDEEWYKGRLQGYDLFSGQDPQKLLNALLKLPPDTLWIRAHELNSYLNLSLLDERSSMIPFWKQFAQEANAFLEQPNSGVDRTKCYSIRELCKGVNSFLNSSKKKEQHSIGEVKNETMETDSPSAQGCAGRDAETV